MRTALCSSLIASVLAIGCGSDSAPADPDATNNPPVPDAMVVDPADARLPVDSRFQRYMVSNDLDGPAYVAVGDLDGDQTPEIVVASLGVIAGSFQGSLTMYKRGATLGDWTPTTISSDFKFANQPTIVDMDGDGDKDILLPVGFFACKFLAIQCGAVHWFEQTASGWTKHDIVTEQVEFYHSAVLADMNGDKLKDLVTVAEDFDPPSKGSSELQVFYATDDKGNFESTPTVIGAGLGSFPRVHDIDDDGDLDIASAEFFHGDDSFAWYERTADGWQRHVIDADSGPSIQMTLVPNLYGDGKLRAVGTNHTNTERDPPDAWESAVLVFEIPDDPTQPWIKTKVSEGIVSRKGDLTMNRYDAPGIHGVGDIDGDGDIDIAVSGDGDQRVFWLEQTAPGQFETHVLEADLGQAGGQVITDLDGDGKPEIIVTGYEHRVVYIYEHE